MQKLDLDATFTFSVFISFTLRKSHPSHEEFSLFYFLQPLHLQGEDSFSLLFIVFSDSLSQESTSWVRETENHFLYFSLLLLGRGVMNGLLFWVERENLPKLREDALLPLSPLESTRVEEVEEENFLPSLTGERWGKKIPSLTRDPFPSLLLLSWIRNH